MPRERHKNHVWDVRTAAEGHDVETMIEHFDLEKQSNEHLYYAYEKSDKNQLTRCFWADLSSRNTYGYFGDMVVFDSTFNINKYGMWFCPLVGINNHRQNVVFGCGVLASQTSESFAWLFEKFVDAIPGHAHPHMIITYQDNTIDAAVRQVFLETIHWLCIWYILAKFLEKMNLTTHREHVDRLRAYIWTSETTAEFKACWAELMTTTPLGDNTWLGDIYELRDYWVPAYLNGHFSAGMTSSQ